VIGALLRRLTQQISGVQHRQRLDRPFAALIIEPLAAHARDPLLHAEQRLRGRGAEADEKIGIDEFVKIDLRVAKILAAEKVKGSRKLIKMQIDVGVEQRTIVAGIAEAYEPDALVGRSIVIVANLKPAKLMGFESNGMVLAASPEGGLPALLGFENPPPPGSRVK
jgi:methionyl-tRNA synthetase